MTFHPKTKTIVIGGTSGIGKAVVSALSEREGTVTAASRSSGLDVTDEAAIAAFFRKPWTRGSCDFYSGIISAKRRGHRH